MKDGKREIRTASSLAPYPLPLFSSSIKEGVWRGVCRLAEHRIWPSL